jgi:microcystin-dependent protein
MSEPFLGEIRIVAFNFAPRGWAFCDGQILPINQNQALFSLLGTTYGGDGRTSFALPDLRSRTPLHVGSSNGTDLGNMPRMKLDIRWAFRTTTSHQRRDGRP